jgi:type II secretory pathway pseudopilin PulG
MWWRRVRYVLLLVALCAIATCPAAQRSCTAKSRAREAEQLLAYLADRVEDAITATGRVPEAPAGPTPAAGCCDQGGTCEPDPAAWSAPGWKALAFSIDGAHRYSYAYVPDPGGRSAVVRAMGDLDCDGEPGLYELEIRIEGGGVERRWTRKDRYE